MQPPKTFHIHHPSGKLYDAFRKFSRAHPEASFFQSDAYFRFAAQWPEAEAVLFVAVKGQKLQDPGIRYRPNGRPGQPWQPMKETGTGGQSEPEEETVVAGSLLAMIIREPTLQSPWWRPFRGLHHKFTARTIIFGGPLLAKGSRLEKEIAFKALLRTLQDHVKKRSVFTEFRNLYDLSEYKPILREQGFEWVDWLNLLVDIGSREKAWAGISENRRRQVKKSLGAGAKIVHDPTPEQIDAFYAILQKLYANKVRKPLPSKEFFHLLNNSKHQGSQPQPPNPKLPVTSLVITYNDRVIAGIACPFQPDKTMYEWYVCGIDKEYKDKDIYPSVLATWAAMKHGAENNIPCFNFMGVGRPDKDYGVRDFKTRFGGKLVHHGRFFMVNRPLRYVVAKLAFNILYGGN